MQHSIEWNAEPPGYMWQCDLTKLTLDQSTIHSTYVCELGSALMAHDTK